MYAEGNIDVEGGTTGLYLIHLAVVAAPSENVKLTFSGNYTGNVIQVASSSVLQVGTPCTLNFTGPSTQANIVQAQSGGIAYLLQTKITGTATGRRYHADAGGLIYTGGRGANLIPGTTAGVVQTASGSVYY